MLDKSKIQSFSDLLEGNLIQPGNADYDKARSLWNGMIDRKPALIAQCMTTSDIINSVNFARDNNLVISIKGGGHGVAGNSVCDDGLMVDLSQMNNVEVDPDAKTARVEPGALLADLDRSSQEHGLATTGGLVSRTGVAGLTLGGGIGYLARKYGLTVDNLISADVVTANGEQIHASKNDNPDLFWALRGGGGNFGIVTSFEYKLHEVGPEILAGQFFFPIEDTERVLKLYRDVMAEAPDELACYIFIANVPPVDPFPEEYHGKTSIAVVACYASDHDSGMKYLKPFKNLGNSILEMAGPMPYTQLQQSFDAGAPDGGRFYWKAHYLKQIPDEAIETIMKHSNPLPGPYSLVGLESMGGMISRVDPEATAFPNRSAEFSMGIWAGWTEPEDDDKIIKWTRDFYKAMEPYTTGGVYMNYLDRDEGDRVKASYGSHFERLQKIKAKYDPDNFFRMNQNIKPKT